jgi:hypothetical protein
LADNYVAIIPTGLDSFFRALPFILIRPNFKNRNRTMNGCLTNGRYQLIRMIAALLVSLLACHCGSSFAQQLQFADLIPSTQLAGFTVGPLTVLVVDANGAVISNSSASVTVSIAGPDSYANAISNTAAHGVTTFDFSGVSLTKTGCYTIAATSPGLAPAFQNVGVEVTMMPPQGTIFAGVYVNPTVTNGPQNLNALEQNCGRTMALHLHYYLWTDTNLSSTSLFLKSVTDDVQNSRIPIVTWLSDSLTNITSGSDDAYIAGVAQEIAAYQGPIIVRWFIEMNLIGTNVAPLLGYPPAGTKASAQQVATAQANYALAWRRIRQIFDTNGAFNVIWLWNPGGGNDSAPGQTSGGYTDGFYPGDSYVDWIGVDAYDRLSDTFVNTFTTDANYNYAAMAAHGKPLMIGETGAYNTNEPNQVDFFDDAVSSLQTALPQFLDMDYFDGQGGENWNLTTNGLPAYSSMVNSAYLGAKFVQTLSYGQYHPFSARVHLAPAASQVVSGANLPVNVSVGDLSSFTPTGTVDIYSDSQWQTNVQLTGGSGNYCQTHATVRLADPGPHNLVAVYSGDANNAAGQSWPVLVEVSAAPVIESIDVNSGTVTLVWSAPANQNFQVQFNNDLTSRSWTNLGSGVTASNSPTTNTDAVGSNPRRYYRLISVP